MTSLPEESKHEETEEKHETQYSEKYEKEYEFVRKCRYWVGGGRCNICKHSHLESHRDCEIILVNCICYLYYIKLPNYTLNSHIYDFNKLIQPMVISSQQQFKLHKIDQQVFIHLFSTIQFEALTLSFLIALIWEIRTKSY